MISLASIVPAACRVRPATTHDLAAITRVHEAAFPSFFLTRLGAGFLHAYYRLVLEHPGGILLVAEVDEGLCGFVAGAVNPGAFYAAMSARKWSLALPVLLSVLRHPLLLPRVVASVRRVAREGSHTIATPQVDGLSCELTSLGVHPGTRGHGVGQQLVSACRDEAARRGASYLFLTTDARDNDYINDFYLHLGFTLEETFLAGRQRPMNRYSVELLSIGQGVKELIHDR